MANQTIPAVLEAGEAPGLLRQRSDVRLLDVRTPGELEAVHIGGAHNVPLDRLGEHAEEIRAHVDEPVVLICQSGTRARTAEEALRQGGMPNLHGLDGGMNAWIAAAQPAERGRERLSLERRVRIIAGGGLVFAGATDSSAMGTMLSKLPYNRPASTDMAEAVRALKTGSTSARTNRVAGGTGPVRPACGS